MNKPFILSELFTNYQNKIVGIKLSLFKIDL